MSCGFKDVDGYCEAPFEICGEFGLGLCLLEEPKGCV